LEAFWADNSATTPLEQLVNAWVLWAARLENLVVLPAVSPYDTPTSVAALEEFRAFNSRRDPITADTILASAAIPNLFRSVRVGDGTYWDGLFSQNPPVRELVDTRPDELWVIQINPRRWDGEPRTMVEIADRRNELAGNLSLHQELGFIEKIDQLLAEGRLAADGRYKQITVRVLELSRSRLSRSLGTASKLNRDPGFIRDLIAHGEAMAEEFLAALAFERAWRRRDPGAVLACFADDAELVSAPPFPDRGSLRGRQRIGRFVREHLTADLHVDPTRKQVTRDRVTWTVQAYRDDPAAAVRGRAEAELRTGRITTLRLGG
ncbi:MAG TPA: nuclear transport factor 2 family protein, partial [Actinomycetes bacterium]|nr:nuclear transport factor 2 family protein [Actinomycetes bacterium]